MKIQFILIQFLLPFFLFAQSADQEVSAKSSQMVVSSTAFKPWMNPYWNSLNNQKVIPFKYPTTNPFSIPEGTYRNIKIRNVLLNEQLSPYLNKVYQNSLHSQTVNDLKYSSTISQSTTPQHNLINRAISKLFFNLQ